MPERQFSAAKIVNGPAGISARSLRARESAARSSSSAAPRWRSPTPRGASTKDIDAAFEPKSAIYTAAERVAEERGLPAGLAQRRGEGVHAGEGRLRRGPLPEIKGIEVTTASPRYLLAMKLMAMRFGEDDEDIEILLEQCDMHTAQEALDLLKEMYPSKEPPAKTRFFLEESLESV